MIIRPLCVRGGAAGSAACDVALGGRLGGASQPSVSRRQSQRPSTAGPKPLWDLKSCYTVS